MALESWSGISCKQALASRSHNHPPPLSPRPSLYIPPGCPISLQGTRQLLHPSISKREQGHRPRAGVLASPSPARPVRFLSRSHPGPGPRSPEDQTAAACLTRNTHRRGLCGPAKRGNQGLRLYLKRLEHGRGHGSSPHASWLDRRAGPLTGPGSPREELEGTPHGREQGAEIRVRAPSSQSTATQADVQRSWAPSAKTRPHAHLFLGEFGFNLCRHLHSGRAASHHHHGPRAPDLQRKEV